MKHNKKRNTGLLYEFLARNAAEGLVENDEKKVRRSVKLMKRFFREGTELHREYRLFRALSSAYVASKETAQRIIETTRSGARQFDAAKLDREKSLLIKSINHTFNDPSFYDKQIDEYKLFATIQMLLNEWRQDVPTDVVRTALFEEDLVEHLTTPKQKNILDENHGQVDDLIINLMVKKVNNKYKGVLDDAQLALMNSYVEAVRGGDMRGIVESIETLRVQTLQVMDEYSKKGHSDPDVVMKRLGEVRSLISEPVTQVDDRTLTRYLRIARLKQEMLGV